MFNPLVFNPGYAGSSGRVNVTAANRQQWVGIEGAPTATVVGADMSTFLLGSPAGVGLVLVNEEVGFFNTLQISGVLSRRFELDESVLSAGVSLGLVNQVFDASKVNLAPGGSKYHNPDDPAIFGEEENGTTADIGFGATWVHPRFHAGISVLHLFAPKPNFKEQLPVYLPRSFFFSAGYVHQMAERPIAWRPSVLIKNSGPAWQFDVNMLAMFRDKYWAGLGWRLQDAVLLMAGLEIGNGIRAGYSYNITTSALGSAGSGGSHEIMLGYTFDLSLGKRSMRYKSVRFL